MILNALTEEEINEDTYIFEFEEVMVALMLTAEIKCCGILKEQHHLDVITQRCDCSLMPVSEILSCQGFTSLVVAELLRLTVPREQQES